MQLTLNELLIACELPPSEQHKTSQGARPVAVCGTNAALPA